MILITNTHIPVAELHTALKGSIPTYKSWFFKLFRYISTLSGNCQKFIHL